MDRPAADKVTMAELIAKVLTFDEIQLAKLESALIKRLSEKDNQ